jgi:mRNA-degrading endonuclease RelE of RelBE toxin-antitoxin system
VEILFIELPVFTKLRPSYLSEDQYQELQILLLSAPDSGALIQHTGGLRKLRFQDPRRQKGKRGGIRIIYYWWKDKRQIWLFTIYSKGEMNELTNSERKALQKMLRKEIESRVKCNE